ncbi:signal peptidase II [Patescibacteria group bacterium]|nr:signal peptidase II [Patescibacteria group bacterium]MBU1721304.1 signal peptidase II [Patescibacteria group bacterium]MBU1900820.1 signal peptidase II [Patescibacteria group bacterium]
MKFNQHIKKFHIAGAILLGGFFFIFDQIAKYIARSFPETSLYVIKPWLGWEHLENTGIAFGIPFPQILLIILTPLLLFFFVSSLKKHTIHPIGFYGIALLLFGAISNLIDRIIFQTTTDYLRIITSIMNIADVMIVVGACLLFLQEIHYKKIY